MKRSILWKTERLYCIQVSFVVLQTEQPEKFLQLTAYGLLSTDVFLLYTDKYNKTTSAVGLRPKSKAIICYFYRMGFGCFSQIEYL